MKQVFAILLLSIHLVNSGGYRLIFDHLEAHAGQSMISRIDEQSYDDQDLLEIRVPVNLPYQTNSTAFERVDGEVTLNGVHYNYVKRKFVNDSLILLCLPNTDKTKLLNARETFFSLVNDLQQGQNSHKQHPLPQKSIKYSQTECIVDEPGTVQYATQALKLPYKGFSLLFVCNNFSRSPEQPPEQLLG